MTSILQCSPPPPAPLRVAPSVPETAPPGSVVAGGPGRPRRRRIDPRALASLLAQGYPVAQVAETIGCTRQHIWRLMRKSRYVRYGLSVLEHQVGKEADGRLAALRPVVTDGLMREIEEGNVRVLLWAAERLGVGAGRYMPALRESQPLPPEIVKQLSQLRLERDHYSHEMERFRRLLAAEREAPEGDAEDDPDVA